MREDPLFVEIYPLLKTRNFDKQNLGSNIALLGMGKYGKKNEFPGEELPKSNSFCGLYGSATTQ